MALTCKISETIYHIGVNDRRKALFENMWPLPQGVAYNAYLIKDEKTALFDTVESTVGAGFVASIEEILGDRTLDYLVINHMEPDHSSEITGVLTRYPKIQIVGNSKTFKILEAYYGSCDNLIEVKDGDELSLGHHNIKFVFTPWVHWPETMMSYDTTDQVLFSADAFGSFGTLDGGVFDDTVEFDKYYESEMLRYYSNIVGKYSNMVQKAFKKLDGVSIKTICPLHGVIWRKNPSHVIGLYDKWSRHEGENAVAVFYASMYGNTAEIADYIARKLSENGVKDIRVYDVSKTHVSYLIAEAWRCKGIILGSCAYNSYMHPMMEQFAMELEHYCIQNKHLALFGSYSWNGGGVRNLKGFAENASLELIAEPVDLFGRPDKTKLAACDAMAVKMAELLKIN